MNDRPIRHGSEEASAIEGAIEQKLPTNKLFQKNVFKCLIYWKRLHTKTTLILCSIIDDWKENVRQRQVTVSHYVK